MSANKTLANEDNQEHIGPDTTGDNIHAKRVASYIWDGSGWIRATAASSGGATEYTDGAATTANPVGGIQVFDNAGTITAVSDANPLPVDATVNATVDLGDQNIGNASAATQRVVLASDQPVIPVSDNSGSLTVDDGGSSLTVDGTVAVSGTVAVTDNSGSLTVDDGGSSITVDASSLPLPTGAATSANQSTANTSLSTIAGDTTSLDGKLVADSSDDLDSGAGTDTVKVQGIAVAASGGHAVITGDTTNGLDVDVTRVSGTVTVDASGSAVPVTDNGGTLSIDDGAGSITVDGTVTANAGTGNFNVNLQDGSGTDITSTGGALDVNIASGASSGTQYTEGDTDATITGTAMMLEGGSNTLYAAPGDSTDGLLVNLGSNNDVSVTGTVAVTDNSGSLTVDDGGSSLTVDGTVAATQSGTWNITNVSGTVSLPTGAATAAKQPTVATEDGAAVANPTGYHTLLRRKDTLSATEVSADGDVIAANSTSKGEQYVKATDTDALLTTIDADTSTLAGAVSGSEMQVDIVSSAAIPITDNAGSITVDGTVGVSGTVTVDASGTTVPVSNAGLTELAAAINGGDLDVNINNVSAALVVVGGDSVDSAITTANIQPIAGRASTATPTAVSADNDAQLLWLTRNGALNIADGDGSLTVDGTVNLSAATSPSQTSPSVTTSSTSVLASNTSRLGATFYNEGSSDCYLKLGATASTTSYSVKISSGGYYELPFRYTGAIDGITSTGTAQLRVTELT